MTFTSEHKLKREAFRNYLRMYRYFQAGASQNPPFIGPKTDALPNHSVMASANSLPLTAAPLPPEIAPSDAASELTSIANKCNVKANGFTWASERLRLQKCGADHRTEIAPNDASIIRQGKEHEVYLWMNTSSAPIPNDPANYDTLAGCYGVLSSAAELVSLIESSDSVRSSHLRDAMTLMAEAQSMVRTCSNQIGEPTDSEQVDAYSWLLQRAKQIGIFIERHMRVDDPAEPEQWHELLARVSERQGNIQELIKKEKRQRKLLTKLEYKLRQLHNTESTEAEVAGIDRTVNDLVDCGLPPSNVEMRELLLAHLTLINQAKQKSPGLELVLREIERVINTSDKPRRSIPQTEPPREVTEVAELLKGRSIALIGGDCRPETKQAIEEAFGLKELVWVETRKGQSYQTFKPVVERDEVVVVLLAIRWVAHSYSEVIHFCKANGKPLVRLPAGYNPNQIASEILNQCGDRLLTLKKEENRGA